MQRQRTARCDTSRLASELNQVSAETHFRILALSLGNRQTHTLGCLGFLLVVNQRVSMVSMRVRDRESIQEAVRRFRKLVERSGLKRETRRRLYYEKSSQIKRRASLRAQCQACVHA